MNDKIVQEDGGPGAEGAGVMSDTKAVVSREASSKGLTLHKALQGQVCAPTSAS